MGMNIYIREVYRHGIRREKDKLFEVRCLCDCSRCGYLLFPRTKRNCAVAYVKTEKDIDRAIAFLKSWSCNGKHVDLPAQYFYLFDDGEFRQRKPSE